MKYAYYNEFDPKAAAWLRELITDGLIPDGDVDERSITEIQPHELEGYIQCHFFAGIGGWPLALELAGWPADRPVWTGSCPCQPFSAAGKQKAEDDERHLWPAFARLIGQCRPPTVFGEQVASKLGREWLNGVFADLEVLGYRAAGADLCAAGVGAPHIRQRLWWVGDITFGGWVSDIEREGPQGLRPEHGHGSGGGEIKVGRNGVSDGRLPGASGERFDGESVRLQPGQQGQADLKAAGGSSEVDGLANAQDSDGRSGVLIPCADGRARRIEPRIKPLVDAGQCVGRVALLRGAGNAIVPKVAQAFLTAYLEAENQ